MRRLKSSSNGGGVKLQRTSNRYRGPFGGGHAKQQKAAADEQEDDGDGSIGSTLSLRDQFDIIVPIKAINRAARGGNRDLSLADSDVSSITADDRKKFFYAKEQNSGVISSPMCCCFVNGGGESVGHDTFNTVLANASMYTGMAAVTSQRLAADETRDPPDNTNNINNINANCDGANGSPSSMWACCGGAETMNWCSLSSLLPADNGTAKSAELSAAAAEASPQSSAIPKGGARSSSGGIGVAGEDIKSSSQYSLFDALSSEEAEWCGVHHGKGLKQGVSCGNGGGLGPGSLNWRASIRKAMPWSRKNGRSSNNNNINYYTSSKPFVAEERQDTSLRIT